MTFLSSLAPVLARPAMQVVAGLLSGVIGGGALVASGAIPFGGSSGGASGVALTACPGSGPILTHVANGEALLVTGRSADGSWLEIFVGQPGVDRGWAPASVLRVETAIDALPVADCSAPSHEPIDSSTPTASAIVVETPTPESAAPSLTPSAPPTASPKPTPKPTPSPTPKPTAKPTPKPTAKPTPKPTPKPDTTGPNLSNLRITSPGPDGNDGAYYIFGQGCNPPHSATIGVTATDTNDALASVTLSYSSTTTSDGTFTTPMIKSGANSWTGTIPAMQSWNPGTVNYSVRAVDSHGNQSSVLDQSSNYILSKGTCFF